MTVPGVAASNVDAARGWDGPIGDFWADNVDRFDTEVADYLPVLLEAVALAPDATVLDVGCGAGGTTCELARRAPAGGATGVDLSARLLDVARRRAAADGVANVRFEQADAQVADLGVDRYDRVVSRNGVVFFGDPVAAFANPARALRPEGRMVLAVWQPVERQEWFLAFRRAVDVGRALPLPPTDGPGPFSFGDRDRVRRVLAAAGFVEPHVADVRAAVRYGDLAATEPVATGIVARQLAELDERTRAGAVAALRDVLRAHAGPGGSRSGQPSRSSRRYLHDERGDAATQRRHGLLRS